MAVPLNTPSSSDRALRALEQERKRAADERATAWTVVWTLFAFKMATVAIIWYAASGSREANAYLVATTWYWLLIPAVAVSGVVVFRWRLVRMRRQRRRLHAAEWGVGHGAEGSTLRDEEIRVLLEPGLPPKRQP